jgi:tetratricopeptide (TPR) repeat protein
MLFIFANAFLMASWVAFRSGDDQLHINLTQSNNSGVCFTVSLNGMDCEQVNHNGVTYDRISVPETSGYGIMGSPAIPRISKLIAIPECQDVVLTVSSNTPAVMNNYNLYPNPQFVINTDSNGAKYSTEEFCIDQTKYEINAYLCDYIATIKSTGYFRDQKFAEIEIIPINYNPIAKTLLINKDIIVNLSFVSPSGNVNVNTGIFNGIASNSMINYQSNGCTALDNDYNKRNDREGYVQYQRLFSQNQAYYVIADYLIIADDQFYDSSTLNTPEFTVSPALAQIAQHRADYNGFYVSVFDVENIVDIFQVASDGPVKKERAIKRFLQAVYNGSNAPNIGDGHFGYILLVGDVITTDEETNQGGVYTSYDHDIMAENEYLVDTICASDYDFSLLQVVGQPPDHFGDFMIGRFSVGNEVQLQNIVTKTVDYEVLYTVDDWRMHTHYRNGNNAPDAEDQNNYYTSLTNRIYQYLPSSYDPYFTHVMHANEQAPLNYGTTIGELNSGLLLINFCEHGAVNFTDVSADWLLQHLTNSNKHPVAFYQSCLVGMYDNQNDCLTEIMTRNSANSGYVNVIAPSLVITINGRDTNPEICLLSGYTYSIWDKMYFIAGEALLDAKMRIASWNSHRYLYNMLGDPALNIMAKGYKIAQSTVLPDGLLITSPIEIESGVTVSISANSRIRFEQNGKLIVKEGAILNVAQGVEFEMGNQNRIIVYGSLNIGSEVRFTGYGTSVAYLELLGLFPSVSFDHTHFQNIKILSDIEPLSYEDCTFNYCTLTVCAHNTSIQNSTFEGTPIYVNGTNHKTFFFGFGHNNLLDSPLTLESVCTFYIYNNVFQNVSIYPYPDAIKLFNSGVGAGFEHTFLDNHIGSNQPNYLCFNNGVFSYNSYVDVINSNFFNRNISDITSLNGSSIRVVGNENLNMVNEGQRFMSSNHAIIADHMSFPYEVTWNYFYESSPGEWMICLDHQNNLRHNVTYNGWNMAVFVPGVNLDLSEFTYLPVWNQNLPPPQPIDVKEMYYMAEDSFKQGDLIGAEQLYKSVISLYPNTEYAAAAAKALLPLAQALYDNLTSLKNYYRNDDMMNTYEELKKVSKKYSILCSVMDKNYPEAIQEYEHILNNSPSYTDSIYAVIDLGYTYILMEENSPKLNYIGSYAQLKPASFEAYIQERDLLLTAIMGKSDLQNIDTNVSSSLIQSVYPNPFKSSVNFSFVLPAKDIPELSIYNIKGQLVKKVHSQSLNKGMNSIVWDGKNESGSSVASGIYFYKLKACGREETGKAVMIR